MQERKVLEKNGVIVTTERIVYGGSNVVPLESVSGSIPFIDRAWTGALILAGLAVAAFAEGRIETVFWGVLLLGAAGAIFHFGTIRELLISTHSGEAIHLSVKSTRFAKELDTAIGRALWMRREAQSEALRSELADVPPL